MHEGSRTLLGWSVDYLAGSITWIVCNPQCFNNLKPGFLARGHCSLITLSQLLSQH